MGKRSNFKRRPQDKYYTPYKAVEPLLPFLEPEIKFWEPCAGDGRLIDHLAKNGHKCIGASDVSPHRKDIWCENALDADFNGCDYIITNPPWTRDLLHPMIDHFRTQAPTWLLFDADWMHTKQARPYLRYCDVIISVGRVSWMENGTSGKDNCAWYRFSDVIEVPMFIGRK
jgi:hypothetical protein